MGRSRPDADVPGSRSVVELEPAVAAGSTGARKSVAAVPHESEPVDLGLVESAPGPEVDVPTCLAVPEAESELADRCWLLRF